MTNAAPNSNNHARTNTVRSAEPTQAEILAELARVRAENERLKAAQARRQTISIKVSEKGAISVYGLGRFPVTLYKGQMERFLAVSEDIKQFIADHEGELAVKD